MSADDVYGPPPQRAGGSGRVVVMPDPHNGQHGGRGIVRVVDAGNAEDAKREKDREKGEPLPLPGWLLKLYFVFPVILYIPDAIFNYFVYSDGATVPQTDNVFLLVSQLALWGFLSIGVVGMAYLLSMLAPWHWMQGHRIQACFCGIGVIIATSITIWNSLAYRSQSFKPFATDQWVYQIWPDLSRQQISITMILAAIAPPFWGLFWAIVQPIQTRRTLSHLAEGHAERMLRMQQEAEIKTMRAEANAKIRAAQLKGMAQTAAAAREQVGVVTSQWRGSAKKAGEKGGQDGTAAQPADAAPLPEPRSDRNGSPAVGRALRIPDDLPPGALRGSMSPTVAAPMSSAPRRPRARADVLTLAEDGSVSTRAPAPSSSTPLGPDGRGSTDHVEAPSAALPRRRVQRGAEA